jgi:WD40 repeat protein
MSLPSCVFEPSHVYPVNSVSISPDGRFIASGCDDGSIQLWDAGTRAFIIKLKNKKSVFSTAFTLDSLKLVNGNLGGSICVWDIKKTDPSLPLKVLEGHVGNVWSLSMSPANGSIIASAGEDKTVRIWDINDGTCIKVLEGHIKVVRAVAFNIDGSRLASSSWDQNICIWDMASFTLIQKFKAHANLVLCLAYSPDGNMLASGGFDGTICIWDAESLNRLGNPHRLTGPVNALVFTPDSSLIISGSNDQAIRGWDTTNIAQVHVWEGHSSSVHSLATSSDGSWFVSGSYDKTVRMWQLPGAISS